MQVIDISPNRNNASLSSNLGSQSVSGKALCVAMTRDGHRVYLGGHSGVWRSDDGGVTWLHPEWSPATPGGPTLPGALPVAVVYDLLIDPRDPDVVFAATGRDVHSPDLSGIYRSTDGAHTWTLSHQFLSSGQPGAGIVTCLSAVADDPDTIYAAGQFAIAWTTSGGASWTESVPDPDPNGSVNHVVAGPLRSGGRLVYAVGRKVWFSLDGGVTWNLDPVALSLGAATDGGGGSSSRALALDPRQDTVVYAMQGDTALWKGVYSEPPQPTPGIWTTFPPLPGNPRTASGGAFVLAHRNDDDSLSLIVSDARTVHAGSETVAQTSDWIRVEDETTCHCDPHGLALTPDFQLAALSGPDHGRAVLVNDGGAVASTDGMHSFTNATNLSTLNVVNPGVNAGPLATALTFGTGDNEGFSSSDASNWKTQDYFGGDNDCSFGDPRQAARMILFAPRSAPAADTGENHDGAIFLFASTNADPPDTSLGSPVKRRVPGPPAAIDPTSNPPDGPIIGWTAVSNYFNYGYRPLVLTLAGEAPRTDSDLVVIRYTGTIGTDPVLLLRTTALSTVTQSSDWVNTGSAEGDGLPVFQVGPALPHPLMGTVQASGGHDRPTFYVGNGAPISQQSVSSPGLWKLAPGTASWQQIVPAAAAGPAIASRFHVDPYRPGLVYVLGGDHVYRSEDGGASWEIDRALEAVATEQGAFPLAITGSTNPAESVLRAMEFDATRPGLRFAVGAAGVFMTTDGADWQPILRSSALAMQPTSITYDPISCERAVYVGTSNRGLLKLSPIPPDWDFPQGSLQATTGHITLLRVHDVGTGFGPPNDVLDAEIIVELDSELEKAFGLQLRDDTNRSAAEGMLALLRDSFGRGRAVRIEFTRTGCHMGTIERVIQQT
jgi:hypothetical protein